MTQVETKIRAFILNNFLFSEDQSMLSSKDSLLEKGVMDSTGVLELISFLEREFEITLDDAEMIPENLDTVERIVSFIERKRGQAQG